MSKIINVILSGGSGTRLWPLSRQSRPKQFLQLFNSKSLFQHTIERNCDRVDEFMLITNKNQYEMAMKQVEEVSKGIKTKIIEPVGRNTAPAIALASFASNPNDILFITPSDQMITPSEEYTKALNRAIELAENGSLVTFGIQPKHAETGFGYIEADGENVLRFTEKPNFKTALKFVEAGNYYWNSGMFCFKASTFLSELNKHAPDIYTTSKKAFETSYNGDIRLDDMKSIPDESIDYAVMEKSRLVKTVPSNFCWTDLGSFDALIDYFKENENHRIVQPIIGSNNSFSISDKQVFASGIDDTLIVDTDDAILLLPMGESYRVKEIYNYVKEKTPKLTL
jgi:mannose-1-phosphate guanylyltransferase